MALLKVNFFSNALGMAMQMDVILPEGNQGVGVAAKPLWDGKEPLPVLYLLHGASDDNTIWQRRTSIERYVADKKLAVVMPNAHLSMYSNQYLGFNFFDFIAYEVPEFCQKYFKVSDRREDNFIAGLSMGGYGTLKIGMSCGDRFSYAASLSGACDRAGTIPEAARSCSSLQELEDLRPKLTQKEYDMVRRMFITFGPPSEFGDRVQDDMFKLSEERIKAGKPMPELFITCGTEDFLIEGNRKFHRHLENLGYQHIYYEAPGIHNWDYWDTHIQKVLDWLPLEK